jgi:DNA-binding NarL/FixJ family response regulator
MKTCLICDDHAMMREALAGAVAFVWPEAQIIQAADYISAWANCLRPLDLIISDLVMPGATPVVGISRMRQLVPDTPIMVITGNEEDDLLLAMLETGISGFVPKTSNSEVIEAAIRLILAGGQYIPPRLLAIASRQSGKLDAQEPRYFRLTQRQTDVLRLIAAGQSNKEAARELDLSPATIKAHTAAAMSALSANNRTEAVIKARELGLI